MPGNSDVVGESMCGSGLVLTAEGRHTAPCSIHRTWRELLGISFPGAPQCHGESLEDDSFGFSAPRSYCSGKPQSSLCSISLGFLGAFCRDSKAAQASPLDSLLQRASGHGISVPEERL